MKYNGQKLLHVILTWETQPGKRENPFYPFLCSLSIASGLTFEVTTCEVMLLKHPGAGLKGYFHEFLRKDLTYLLLDVPSVAMRVDAT